MDRDFIRDLFAPFADVSVRRMFGGFGVYRDGLMFALATGGEIYVKADAASRAIFEAAGSYPFAYMAKERRVETSYWLLPAEALDDPDAMARYAGLGLEAALRAQAGKGRKPKREV
ncbi:TfoX/Sxy family protein [Propylenella binzhouense]|uniref:TfoX family protein n=1 Tax=Propylenella binzhouense TaxID=2555902 RepID=A0A964T460_9HYPH|nr:TfoX/Sxy family protein [Propylenella binzhouense]MYZ47202.1 TfoX family protein [Propylenella binzhouense]